MPLDSKELLGSFGSKLRDLPVISTVVKNPFYTACLICGLIVVIVIIVFRDTEGSVKLAVKVGLYSLLFVTGIQFLQNKQVIDEYKDAKRSDIAEQIFDSKDINRGEKPINVIDYIPSGIDPIFV